MFMRQVQLLSIFIIFIVFGCAPSSNNNTAANRKISQEDKRAIYEIYVNSVNLAPSSSELIMLNKLQAQPELSPMLFKEILLSINANRLSQVESDEIAFNRAEQSLLHSRSRVTNDDFIPSTFGAIRGDHFAIIEGSLRDQRKALTNFNPRLLWK